jgi:ABC-type transport system involved in multi-copper enzyme maturation permease subunit
MRAFAVLAVEAARDAFRRRFALALAVLLVLSLAWVNTCTGLGAGVSFNEQQLDPAVVAGFLAPILFSVQAMAVLWVAGVLASDHLARPLSEGSAALWLARPVSRGAWAGARLAGALAVALAAGAVLLGFTAALLARRYGVAPGPAVAASLATALGAVVVAALTATASLAVGRTAVLLAMAAAVPLQFFSNAAGLGLALLQPDAQLPGLFDALHRFGPPLGTAVLAATAAWNPQVVVEGLLTPALGRLALWAGGAIALLLLACRRLEIGR